MIISDTQDSWSSSRDEFRSVTLPKLSLIGKQIGEMASAGDVVAQDIIQKYEMLRRSFDPMTHILLKKAIEIYETSK